MMPAAGQQFEDKSTSVRGAPWIQQGRSNSWGIVMKLRRRQFLHLAAGALTLGVARAEDKTSVMKVTGPTINDTPHLFMKNFAAAVERDSGGRIKGQLFPASQLGSVPRQIEGTQFGAIQAQTSRRSSSSASTNASR
jgi:TRAP-type C4-dicarboxylate transport system substrate-binding protein